MRKVSISLIVAALLLADAFALAQTTTPPIRLRERILERARITQQEFEQNRAELKQLMQEQQEEFRNQIQLKREEMKAKIEQFREQLRERMRERISEQKQKIVERIYERINALNERITNHYLDVLDHLEKVLERIESRTEKARLNGKDVSSVDKAIDEAHKAIDTAREAVKVQAEKVYQPPEITTEGNLRLDVGKLRKALHDDLKAVEKLVKDARDAVRKAAVALAQIPKVDELEVATTTQPTQ